MYTQLKRENKNCVKNAITLGENGSELAEGLETTTLKNKENHSRVEGRTRNNMEGSRLYSFDEMTAIFPVRRSPRWLTEWIGSRILPQFVCACIQRDWGKCFFFPRLCMGPSHGMNRIVPVQVATTAEQSGWVPKYTVFPQVAK